MIVGRQKVNKVTGYGGVGGGAALFWVQGGKAWLLNNAALHVSARRRCF